MKCHRRAGALCAGMLLCGIFSTANAALVSRLNGDAVYDTDLNITWLANANAAVGSTYDTLSPGTGIMTWSDANAWAAGLVVDGVSGWRLPTTLQPDASCQDQSGGVSFGYNCTGSEMGHLYYDELNTSNFSLNNSNFSLFTNIQRHQYWSATEYNSYSAWALYFADGFQGSYDKTNGLYAWAVHTGDVGTVPVPAAVWLFGSGLLGLFGVARRNAA